MSYKTDFVHRITVFRYIAHRAGKTYTRLHWSDNSITYIYLTFGTDYKSGMQVARCITDIDVQDVPRDLEWRGPIHDKH